MAVGDVRHFARTLECDLPAHEEAGWLEWGRELIPSIPHEPIVMLEWQGKGEPKLPDDAEAITANQVKPVENITGLKNDDLKDRWDLLFVMLADPLHDVLKGLQYGARKYNENPDRPNFQRLKDPKRRLGNAALRHLFAALNGEEIDDESGIPHLSLAAINMLFLRWHQQNEHKEK